MWLLFRLLSIVGLVIWKLFPRPFGVESYGDVDGRKVLRRVSRDSKHKRVTKFEVGASLPKSQRFSFTVEKSTDRWFKSVGLSQEVQTGDCEFDERVYAACDHEAMHALLKSSPSLRKRIMDILNAGIDRIEGDGSYVWIMKKGDEEPNSGHRQLAADLATELSAMDKSATWLTDRYWQRVIAVEVMLAMLVGYAVGALVRMSTITTVYPRLTSLLLMSVAGAAVVLLVVGAVIVLLLRGSSRAHRTLIEAGLVMVVAIPGAGYVLACDINESSAQGGYTAKAVVVDKQQGGKKSRRWHALTVDTIGDGQGDAKLNVSADVYNRTGSEVAVDIGAGVLGVPYIREVRP
jgi:hypothetical protein